MSTEKAKRTPKKGTAATEVVIGSAAGKLGKAINSIKEVAAEVNGLAAIAEEQQGIIAQREERIKDLDVEYAEARRQKSVELELTIREDEKTAVETILSKQNKVAVPADEYAMLKSDMEKVKAEAENETSSAVAIERNSLTREHNNAVALLKAGFEKDQATTQAQLSNAQSQITFLTEQVALWKSAVDAERAAGVERAKASSIGTVSIGTNTK